MKKEKASFNVENIHTVTLKLLDGQVELIKRALELYGYNLEYMLNNEDTSNFTKQEKCAMIHTYEQILAFQVEQISQKDSNTNDNNILNFDKISVDNNEIFKKNFKVL